MKMDMYVPSQGTVMAKQWVPENEKFLLNWLRVMGFEAHLQQNWANVREWLIIYGPEDRPWHMTAEPGMWIVWDTVEGSLTVVSDAVFQSSWRPL